MCADILHVTSSKLDNVYETYGWKSIYDTTAPIFTKLRVGRRHLLETYPEFRQNRSRNMDDTRRNYFKLNVHESVHRDAIMKVTDKMQLYWLIYYS